MLQREILTKLFDTAVQSALPENCLVPFLQSIQERSIVVLALGKSATQMTAVAERVLGARIRRGLAVTAYQHSEPCVLVPTMESAHPVPDEQSCLAAHKLLDLARSASKEELVLVLLSGGGSALACAPIEQLPFTDKQAINKQLLASGAKIDEINSIRKHLSNIKGGRLALAAQPARVITLAISDVPAASPQSIASGPTLADESTCADCLDIIERYSLSLPPAIIELFEKSAIETEKPDSSIFRQQDFRIIAGPQHSITAACKMAEEQGIVCKNLGSDWYGDAEDIAQAHLDHIRKAVVGTLILSGGEASVQVKGKGKGGRNGQFLLALACRLQQARLDKNIWAIACDTDGIDGKGDNAGCILAPDSLARAEAMGLQPYQMLAENNSYPLFSALGDLVMGGPTGTNVNDFRAILVL